MRSNLPASDLIAGIIASCSASVMVILSVLGIWHLGRTSQEAELLGGHRQ